MIDLRSDTVTIASPEMQKRMIESDGGDDYYGESVSTNELEMYCARFFGKEKGLFFPSGTMANLAALLSHTRPGNEIILDAGYHIYSFGAGQTAMFAGVAINLLRTEMGIITSHDVETILSQKYQSPTMAKTKLICLENSINSHGGKIFPLETLKEVREIAIDSNIDIHLDGARLLNACAATNINPLDYANCVDSVMLSFSKGLGAPFGAILVGNTRFIQESKKFRRWLGGGLHQAGALSAAALYALQENVAQLHIDNQRAKLLEKLLSQLSMEIEITPVETNIVMMILKSLRCTADKFCHLARLKGLLLFSWDKYRVRAVMHVGIDDEKIYKAVDIIKELLSEHQN